MTLTQNQIQYFIKHFFLPNDYAGAESIAKGLLTRGTSLVAGTKCIWTGGVGNFIKIKPFDGAYQISEYVFDLEGFLSSSWVQDITKSYYDEVFVNLKEEEKRLADIGRLIK